MPSEGDCVKQVRQAGPDIVVTLAGAVDLHHTPRLHQVLIAACASEPRRLIIDLTEVSYMDSSALGALVEILRRVNAYRGKLALCGMAERVHSVFEITKLDKFFPIFATESEAMAG